MGFESSGIHCLLGDPVPSAVCKTVAYPKRGWLKQEVRILGVSLFCQRGGTGIHVGLRCPCSKEIEGSTPSADIAGVMELADMPDLESGGL